MAVFNTNGATLKIDISGTFTQVPGIIDGSISLNIETVDVTEVGSTDRKYIPGIRNATLQGNLYYNQDDATIAALEAAAKTGADVAVQLKWHTQSSGTAVYSGNAIVTSWAPSIAINDVVRVALSMQFNGEVTIG